MSDPFRFWKVFFIRIRCIVASVGTRSGNIHKFCIT